MSSEADPAIEELDEIEENVQDVAEEIQDDIEEVGTTSAEQTGRTDRSSRFDFLKTLTIYDAMLIASAVSVSFAILLMFLELTSFGFPFFQWRTTEAEVAPITLP